MKEFDDLTRALEDLAESIEKLSIQIRFEYDSWSWYQKVLFHLDSHAAYFDFATILLSLLVWAIAKETAVYQDSV